ncbi:unnamed protein product [Cylicostephanus goldi]|uniref:SCP domain-containing protein n=1 Tax=Cylicostephanus goldi TaxID=71465 RepID=A0A3P6SCY1_CYLGO|nr:unnamed protein product [Cylicostephanus goldi]
MRSIFEYLAIFFAVLLVVKAQDSTGNSPADEEEFGTTCPVLTTQGTTTTTAASAPNTICPDNDSNDALRNATLDFHNTNRANLANGQQTMGSAKASMRKANNMPELVSHRKNNQLICSYISYIKNTTSCYSQT